MDSNFIRQQFSSLTTDFTYFENAGGTQVPDQVIQKVSDHYRKNYVQPAYSFSKAVECNQIITEARQFISDWIGASSPDLVAFGPSATDLNRIAAVSLHHTWKEGDEIIITNSDHEANVTPWLYLENFGLKVKFWNINPETFELELHELEKLLTSKTVLVAFPHISNILGLENPVAEIAKFVHDAGAWVYVDGVASTPHKVVDVEKWDVDFFVFSTYKTFGPHMAALYVRREIFEKLKSANHFFLENKIPRKFELGTPNMESFAALAGLKEYFEKIFSCSSGSLNREKLVQIMGKIHDYENGLTRQLLDGLNQNPQIRILGPANPSQLENRVPIFSFDVNGVDPGFIHKNLAEQNIAAGLGHFYAYRIVDYFGLIEKGGVTRASLVHYNTAAEIDNFLKILNETIDLGDR